MGGSTPVLKFRSCSSDFTSSARVNLRLLALVASTKTFAAANATDWNAGLRTSAPAFRSMVINSLKSDGFGREAGLARKVLLATLPGIEKAPRPTITVELTR